MKSLISTSIAAALAMTMSAAAMADTSVSYDYGTVVSATPIVKHVRVSTPVEECWDETVAYKESGDSGVSTVVGAVIGGAIGNAVGHSNTNKKVGTAVGAVLGGTIGNSVGKDSGKVRTTTEEVCQVKRTYHEEERVIGYQVKYEYNGQVYTTRTDTDPGDTIKLRLSVSPAE